MNAAMDAIRRTIDIVVSALALVAFAPLIALLIRLDSPGPALYRAQRAGRFGHPFIMLKFRTMFHEAGGSLAAAKGDPRVTRVGEVLRWTKLDELPQFINVLRGDMALVGPRPDWPQRVALYSQEQREILSVRPGLTDYASLKFIREAESLGQERTDEQYSSEIQPAKMALRLAYVRERTLRGDLYLIGLTIVAVLKNLWPW